VCQSHRMISCSSLRSRAPSSSACAQTADSIDYAYLEVDARNVSSGCTASFTGTLSPTAMSSLNSRVKGGTIVCLARYPAKAQPNRSWVTAPPEGACTTVRKDGSLSLGAVFGRQGRYFHGPGMGPCRPSADLCGNGDGQVVGLYGKGDKVVAQHTT
jgi:hypothetical protein